MGFASRYPSTIVESFPLDLTAERLTVKGAISMQKWLRSVHAEHGIVFYKIEEGI